ncbi:MAG TPA: hypothetical protein VJC39_05005 [Candidatus Nanoarchaeia archaeon]|nr:hypothetical protein [Candidatus Nanoarchaeia archaeon]
MKADDKLVEEVSYKMSEGLHEMHNLRALHCKTAELYTRSATSPDMKIRPYFGSGSIDDLAMKSNYGKVGAPAQDKSYEIKSLFKPSLGYGNNDPLYH